MKEERLATLSSCCGFTGEAALSESAIIMVYAGMLGGSEALRVVTTAVFPFLSGVLMLPFSYIALRLGSKRLTVTATFLAWLAYLCIPFVGCSPRFQVPLLLSLMILFSSSVSGFVVGWFPLLDSFLAPGRRTLFLGRMRFCHQLCATVFLLLAGWWLGASPSLLALQSVLFLAALIFLGRALFLLGIPAPPKADASAWCNGVLVALRNPGLRRSAAYIFLLNLACYGMAPLWILYLQRAGASENRLVFLSAAMLTGMMLGYSTSGKWIASPQKALPWLQLTLLTVSLLLFFLPPSGTGLCFGAALVLLALHSMLVAQVSVAATGLMMTTAVGGNKIISMAVFGTLGNTGMGLSRVFVALLLHGALLSFLGSHGSWPFYVGMGLSSALLVLAFYLRPQEK